MKKTKVKPNYGSKRITKGNGYEETFFSDGTIIKNNNNNTVYVI